MVGLNRNLYQKSKLLLDEFPVLAILGARQVGKTTLSKQLGPNWKYFDLENPNDFEFITHDPVYFFEQYPSQVIIDEAQIYPDLFKVLRGIIDANRQHKGRFIITGSSSPELLSKTSESLAGRVSLSELSGLKANEVYKKPLSPFYKIFEATLSESSTTALEQIEPLSREAMQQVWLKGGYPEPLLSQQDGFYHRWMESYQDTYINRDLAVLFPRLNKVAYRRFLSMLGKLSGSILNKRDLARAIEVSEPTITQYLDIAHGTYLWRKIPSFHNSAVKSIIKMPKGHIRDTGLLHAFLKIQDMDSLLVDPIVGHSFEAFVIEEIIKGLQATLATNWDPFFYRTKSGAEIDLIIEGPFGLLPIEIKHGVKVQMKRLQTLSNFVKDHQLPFGILVNQGHEIKQLSREIIQVPIQFL